MGCVFQSKQILFERQIDYVVFLWRHVLHWNHVEFYLILPVERLKGKRHAPTFTNIEVSLIYFNPSMHIFERKQDTHTRSKTTYFFTVHFLNGRPDLN